MELLVLCNTLILHIVSDHREIAILTHGIDIVSVCPELSSPQEFLHFWMGFKYHSAKYSFDCADHT